MLRPKQEKCIRMLILGTMTQAEIARELKVTEQTVCNWKKNEEFAAELEKASRSAIRALVPRAIQKAAALLDAESEQVQLAAAKDILDRAGYKSSEIIQLDGTLRTSEKLADVFRQIGGEGLDE